MARSKALFAGLAAVAVGVASFGAYRIVDAGAATVDTPVAVAEYNLGDTEFTDPPDWAGAAEVKAVVHYPRRFPGGKVPLIVLLHGQNLSCDTDNEDDWGDWPCPAGVRPYSSYRGYDYLGDALANSGYVVVSLSADGVNAGMGIAQQRSRLINRHLALWQQLSATGGGPLAGQFTDAAGRSVRVDFRGRVDMTRVGTMGHSVAGEGVMWQASDKHRAEWPAGVQVRAVVPLASRYFTLDEDDNSDVLITRVPFAVVSATCWGTGDRQYFDNARGLTKVPAYLATVVNANHNYFNSVWTSGRGPADGDDTTCPNTANRPSAPAQQDFAVAYLRAFYGLALKGDASGEAILTGAGGVPGVTTKMEWHAGR